MDKAARQSLLQTMIDFFEAGNKESDRTAKVILEWDFENKTIWQEEITHLQESGKWTGLRAPEADIIAGTLRDIQQELST